MMVPTSRSWIPRSLLILAAGIWIFSPAFFGGWIWDDQRYISENDIIHDPEGFWRVWVNPDGQGNYYPLTSFVEWLEWQWWGNATLGYHLVDLALHLASAFLIWRLFARFGIRLAWLGALLFTVHPVMVESVEWICELKNTLALPPLLLAMLAWLTWTETGERRSYFAALALFIISLLAKTSGVMLPIILLGYAWSKSGKIEWREIRPLLPFFAIAAVAAIVTLTPFWPPDPSVAPKAWSLLPAFATVGWSALFMFGKCVFPVGLQPVYESLAIGSPSLLDVVPYLLLAVLTVLLWRSRAPWSRALLLGFGFFLVNLAPVLVYTFSNYSIMVWSMDHLVYLPVIGLIALAVTGLAYLDRILPTPIRASQWVLVSAAMALMAWSSHSYADWFIASDDFWARLLRQDPQSWIAELNLGTSLDKQKRYPEALAHFQKLLVLRPDLDDAHHGLGTILEHMGRIPEAEAEYHRALAINPRYVSSYVSLGQIQRKAGQFAAAEELFAKGLEIDPNHVSLLTDQAGVLYQSGHTAEAVVLYQRAVEHNPRIAQLQFDLGKALLQQGNFPAAADHFFTALDLDPTLARAHGSLGIIFAQSQRLPEAIEQFQAALQVDSTLIDSHLNLARALTESGRIPEAIEEFRSVLRLDPGNALARDSIAKLEQYQLQHGGAPGR